MTDTTRLLAEATPLPWRNTGPTYPDGDQIWLVGNGHQEQFIAWTDASIKAQHDFELMAYAVNRLPDYEAAVDALAGLLVEVEWWDDSDEPYPIYAQMNAKAWRAARAALARLREPVPA